MPQRWQNINVTVDGGGVAYDAKQHARSIVAYAGITTWRMAA